MRIRRARAHRSGTDRDRATTEWGAELVSDLGDVTTAPMEFDRRRIVRRLEIDGDRPYFDPNGS